MQYLIPFLAQAVALVRVWTLPGRRFRWFAAYLCVAMLSGAALWTASHTSKNAYAYTYVYTGAVIDLLWAAMALELYSRVSALYPGLNRLGWVTSALGVAILATFLTLVDPHATPLQKLFFVQRATSTVLACAIAVLALFFGYFRNSLPRNAVAHAAVMAAYFVTQAAGYFTANVIRRIGGGSAVAAWGGVACYVAWALLLKPAGENRPATPRDFSDADIEDAGERAEQVTREARRIGRGNTGD